MARKKKESSGGSDAGAWLNTYADMVTLLLTFFILLYSMSSVDAGKFNMLVTAFSSDKDSDDKIILRGETTGDKKTGANAGAADGADAEKKEQDLNEIFEILSKYVEENKLSGSVEVSQGESYVFIRFMDGMLFAPNSATLKTEDLEILDFVGNGIKQVEDKVNAININGYTAAIPGMPDYAVSDRILSTDRANAVLMYLEDKSKVAPEKMLAIGFGKYKPFTTNDTEEGRQKNRRVEIIISTDNVLADQLDGIYERVTQ